MPKLQDAEASRFVKALYIGGSGSGKTGSLVSLVKAGYKVRVLDMDNGIPVLAQYVEAECPDKMGNVDFMSFRDKFKSDPIRGAVVSGQPKAYTSALAAMNKWEDGSTPSEWGEDTVFVLDTLSSMGRAAFLWAQGMNPTAKDPRQWFSAAQDSLRVMLELLTSREFKAHLLVISHITLVDLDENTTKGYPSAIGKALSTDISKLFNNLLLAETSGAGTNVRRIIRTVPTGSIDVKTSAPLKLAASYPLSSGLADIFKVILA